MSESAPMWNDVRVLTESKWVQDVFHSILFQEPLDGISFEPTYRQIYELTIRGHGEKVHEVLRQELKLPIARIGSALMSDLSVEDFDLAQRPSKETQFHGAPLSLLLGYLRLSEVRGVSAANTSIRLFASEVLEACKGSSLVLVARRRVHERAEKQLAAFWKNAQLVASLCAHCDQHWKRDRTPCVSDLAASLLEQGVDDLLRKRFGLRSLDTPSL